MEVELLRTIVFGCYLTEELNGMFHVTEFAIAEEFQVKLDEMPDLKIAFDA